MDKSAPTSLLPASAGAGSEPPYGVNVLDEQPRFFIGREVPAPWHLCPLMDVVGAVGPFPSRNITEGGGPPFSFRETSTVLAPRSPLRDAPRGRRHGWRQPAGANGRDGARSALTPSGAPWVCAALGALHPFGYPCGCTMGVP
jgi:hypothetical protein